MRDAIIADLRRRGYRVKPSGKRDEMWLCCPFCPLRGKTPDTEFKLGVNCRTGQGNCFRCKWSSRDSALNQLKVPQANWVVEDGEIKKPEKVQLPEDFELIETRSDDEWMIRAVNYLTVTRGLTLEQISKHFVGVSFIGKFRYRVIFPIARNKELVGYTGRTLVDSVEPKWLHSENLKAVYPCLYGRFKHVVLVEGVFDALAVERAVGVSTDVVALMGTHLPEDRISWVERYEAFTLFLDPDTAGYEGVLDVAQQLRDMGKQVFIIKSDKEPADLTGVQLVEVFGSKRTKWSSKEALSLIAGI